MKWNIPILLKALKSFYFNSKGSILLTVIPLPLNLSLQSYRR